MVAGGEAGTGKIACGPQHRGDVSGRMGVEQRKQVADGRGVMQVASGAGGQRPRPAQAVEAQSEDVSVVERAPGVAQRFLLLAARGSGECFRNGEH